MNGFFRRFLFLILAAALTVGVHAAAAEDDTPVARHGALSVEGAVLVDRYGNPFQLRGVSTHGITWDVGKPYVTEATFRTLRDDWGANAVRLALYTMEWGGYCNGGDQTALKQLVEDGVSFATSLGLYVVIDWHTLTDGNPLSNKEEAKRFFGEMSRKYKDHENVLYEICNEPNGCTWDEIKAYAGEVIPVIRENDPDAVIIVGTPSWSQLGAGSTSNEVADHPLTGYDNLVYSLHFYAAEAGHNRNLPAKLTYAVAKGLPVFVSEFGLSEASGRGRLDPEAGGVWLNLLDRHHISYFCWSMNNLDVSSALLAPGTAAKSDWTDDELSASGKWIKAYYSARRAETESPFRDTAGLWMDEAVRGLSSRGIVNGIGGGLFAPNRSVTRAEFLTMLMRALAPAPAAQGAVAPFLDVPADAYYFDAVCKARAMGIVQGAGGNRFFPGEAISRQDMFVMLYHALAAAGRLPGSFPAQGTVFADWNTVADYAAGPIEALARLGLVNGKAGGILDPGGTATRAEAAQLLYHAFPDSDGE